ncbi:MAG: peptide ABC transporter permease [Hyphomicrobiales bacterium]|nr:MAG: peptide ABC transporter permease [Hyphomicrobiales bacterium]
MFQRLRFLPKGDPLASPHRRVPWFSLGVFAMLFVCGLFPGLVAPMDPLKANFLALNAPPLTTAGGQLYLLGSDHLGRDVLSRIVHGSSIALYVSLIAVLFSSVIGTTLGLLAGYYRGWVDQLVMRVADTWIALPTVSFAIFLTAMREPGATNIIIVMILVFWTRYARIVRGEVLSLRERDFVKLAITAGASPLRILFVHLLPNVINSVIVLATLLIGNVILSEATLSFLGLGVPAPHPAWGAMLADGRNGLMSNRWWATVFPGLAIILVVGASNVAGDWLRRRLDPNLRNL